MSRQLTPHGGIDEGTHTHDPASGRLESRAAASRGPGEGTQLPGRGVELRVPGRVFRTTDRAAMGTGESPSGRAAALPARAGAPRRAGRQACARGRAYAD